MITINEESVNFLNHFADFPLDDIFAPRARHPPTTMISANKLFGVLPLRFTGERDYSRPSHAN